MITGPLKSRIDSLWTDFWTGGITNPLTVIEQITFLMYSRLLDMKERADEKRASLTGQAFTRRFGDDEQDCRWETWRHYGSEKMLPHVRDRVFAMPQPRPLPVIVLADVSGSMSEDGKIDILNNALKSMILSFGAESKLRAEIQVGLITFGGEVAKEHLPLVAADRIAGVEAFRAQGRTPMGSAFEMACQLLEDKEKIPARAYRPVLVLVSDGAPTDDWEQPLLLHCRRSASQVQAVARAQSSGQRKVSARSVKALLPRSKRFACITLCSALWINCLRAV